MQSEGTAGTPRTQAHTWCNVDHFFGKHNCGILAGSHTKSYCTSHRQISWQGTMVQNSSTKHQRAWLAETYCYEKKPKNSIRKKVQWTPLPAPVTISCQKCKTNPCTKSTRCLDEAYKSLLHCVSQESCLTSCVWKLWHRSSAVCLRPIAQGWAGLYLVSLVLATFHNQCHPPSWPPYMGDNVHRGAGVPCGAIACHG